MRLYPPSVAQKIAGGYLLVTVFYALFALGRQTSESRDLVTVDFRAMGLARELRSNLLAQERLEKQLLILRDPDLAGILRERLAEFGKTWDVRAYTLLLSLQSDKLVAPLREPLGRLLRGAAGLLLLLPQTARAPSMDALRAYLHQS